MARRHFFRQNDSPRLTPGHRESSELGIASFQERSLKLAVGTSGLLGVRAGPVPPHRLIQTLEAHAFIEGGGRPGGGAGCGEGSWLSQHHFLMFNFLKPVVLLLLLLVLMKDSGSTSSGLSLNTQWEDAGAGHQGSRQGAWPS